ncbi:uncharacterized protein F5891DRAFT_1191991 [Suillus fuscotomentosus]|uniref:Uncharacterized protein n=1 Tax=Suillus fuscotomentosus TaxID=1912939 RepID=A0AAD4HID4_9AGAM|nr:uncharacterized protein F5891DRAFT_1191991 [Suillus fuscotomentosus]KAG1897296.1 hypothetical protein F5891DRAFT_1191991 [Suillus fuscotomentosus]
MTPADTANEALDTTLAAVQLLIKRCTLLESGYPEALRISDEIARRVAKDLKLHGGNATSFSPQLLSCTAVVRECSKAGTFQTMPDWTSMIDNDPRIKGHPRFNKTLNYRSRAADEIPILLDSELVTSSGTHAAVHFAPLAIAPPPTLSPLPIDRAFVNSPSQAIAPPSPSPTSMALEPLTPLPVSAVSIPSKYNLFVPGTKNAKTAPKAGNRKKRKAEDNGAEEVKLGNIPNAPSRLGKSSQKRSKHVSGDDRNEHTDIASVIENVAPERSDSTKMADERGFWDAETRPVEWGRDSAIATAAEKCDKCSKSGVACLVLPDKKFRCIRLACANCDEMKVTCAINGVGVQERMQAKAKAMAAEAVANPTRRSKSRAPKSRVINKTVVNTRSRKMPMPPNRSLSVVEDDIVEHEASDLALAGEPKYMDVAPAQAEVLPIPTMGSCVSVEPQGQSVALVNPVECEPTARDILQSIQDLGRRLDGLATNDRVDNLEERLDSVEEVVGRRLDVLERKLRYSDSEWKATSSSLRHLTMSLRDHMDDLTAHRPRIDTTAYAPPHHGNVHLPAWLANHDDDPNISAIGRQWTHAWDASVLTGVHGHVGTSASAAHIAETPDPAVLPVDADACVELCSELSTISD